MSYIDSNLLPSEQVLFRTKKSKLVFFYPSVITIVIIMATQYMLNNEFLVKLAWTPWIVVVVYWAYVGLEYMTSEYAVTNKRVMMREGFFTRHANETRLSAISQVNVEQSIIGMMLNYGTVSLNAFGAFDAFPMIDKPFQFQKAVNAQMDVVGGGS